MEVVFSVNEKRMIVSGSHLRMTNWLVLSTDTLLTKDWKII